MTLESVAKRNGWGNPVVAEFMRDPEWGELAALRARVEALADDMAGDEQKYVILDPSQTARIVRALLNPKTEESGA